MSDSTTRASRRTVLKVVASAVLTPGMGSMSKLLGAPAPTTVADDGFINVRRPPDSLAVITDDGRVSAARNAAKNAWDAGDVQVKTTSVQPGTLRITVTSGPKTALKQIEMRWNGATTAWQHVLGDHWERAYGDLQWHTPDPARVAPWYLLAQTDHGTHAVGVATQPNAFCGWTCDADGLLLTCDVRSGGVGVLLGERRGRELHVCDVTARRGCEQENVRIVSHCRIM